MQKVAWFFSNPILSESIESSRSVSFYDNIIRLTLAVSL